MKRILTGILVVSMLVCFTAASAANAGSSSDPLLSQSYIDAYTVGILSEGQSQINSRLDLVYSNALAKLENEYNEQKAILTGQEYLLATAQEHYIMPARSAITGITGTSVIALRGKITVTVNRGTVINVATGEEVASGTELTLGMRYFCAEDTTAVFSAAESSECTVNGQFKVSGGASKAFSAYADVSPSDWYYEYAKYVYDNDIFYKARVDKVFREDVAVTRADFVYALWRVTGSPEPTTVSKFKDLKETWYVSAVTWASENAIVEGYSETEFAPNDKVTREQIATLLYRYAKFMHYNLAMNNDLSSYTDADKISDWALDAMKWANRQQIITGVTTTTLEPQGTAIRSQVAAIIQRYCT